MGTHLRVGERRLVLLGEHPAVLSPTVRDAGSPNSLSVRGGQRA